MFKYIAALLATIVIVFIAVVIMQPDTFSIQRAVTIAAPASKIFGQVNDLRKWNAWSPWARLDPNIKPSFENDSEGTGAIMRWDGNNDVGTGSMTIIDSKPNESITIKLDMQKPLTATNTVLFTFNDVGNQTTVTWSMEGTNSFISKAFGLVFNCEKLVGDQFEQGLANLKALTEPKKPDSK